MIELCGIKHISFDAWNTLIEPNVLFAKARTSKITDLFKVYNQATSATKYTATKKFLDGVAELTGFGATVDVAWKLLSRQFRAKVTDQQLNDLQFDVEQLFSQLPPSIPDELVLELQKLKASGYTMSILSNTNFISGTLLMDSVFNKQFGNGFFDFALFSDQEQMSKPNRQFFNKVHQQANSLHVRAGGVKPSEILHIGDNKITDSTGGHNAGFMTGLVRSPTNLAEQLAELSNSI